MQIASWNVNSLKIRLPQVLAWLDSHPEITALALQETKLEDENFPREEIEAAGLHVAFIGQKTYNGVAIISREPLSDIRTGIPGFDDIQQRVISATLAGIRMVCVYVPNGQSLDSDKFPYKLAWLKALHAWLKTELAAHPKLALLGDFNIAPADSDVHDPAIWKDQVLVSKEERAALQSLLDLGLHDAFRRFIQAEESFTWWDYRGFGFQKNAGLRIDHILLSSPLADQCSYCYIDKAPRRHERPSDHTPIIATLDDI